MALLFRDTLIISFADFVIAITCTIIVYLFIGEMVEHSPVVESYSVIKPGYLEKMFQILDFFFLEIFYLKVYFIPLKGYDLVFTASSYALSFGGQSAIWYVLFFLLVITLGLSTSCSLVLTPSVSICDQWPDTLGKKRWLISLFFCLIMFILGLPLCCNVGFFIFSIYSIQSVSH